jgi:hypothetical protein
MESVSRPTLTQGQWQGLVERYAPYVELSATEPYVDRFRPSSIDWFLANATMRDHEDPTFAIVGPSRADLHDNPATTRFLQANSDTILDGNFSTATMYAHVRDASAAAGLGEVIDIQYWFFYPNNGATTGPLSPHVNLVGAHEGDWEHVTVRVKNWRVAEEAEIVGVFYAAHTSSEGTWVIRRSDTPTHGAYVLVKSTHPLVFSAWHTHASYECSGTQTRYLGFANDHCSSGLPWSPAGAVELASVDLDVYLPGDEQAVNEEWLAFAGKWGAGDGAPVGPSQKKVWNDDGTNGYYYTLAPLGSFGTDWGDGRACTGVALGLFGGERMLAVARDKGDHQRFMLFSSDGTDLQQRYTGGESWGTSRGATCIALGVLGDQALVAVGRSSGDHDRFELYKAGTPPNVTLVASGGESWGSSRGTTAVAFGVLGQEPLFAVGRNGGGNQRFFVYRWDGGLADVWQGGTDWPDDRSVTGIAFGALGDRHVLGVARSDGKGNRVEIYAPRIVDGKVAGFDLLAAAGSDWGNDRAATGIAFGVLDNTSVVGVTRNAGDHARLIVYRLDGTTLVTMADNTADNWSSKIGATGVSFDMVNGEGVVGVSRDASSGNRVVLYKYQGGTLVDLGGVGDHWGDSRTATAIALGQLGGMPVVSYGRNSGNNSRGGALKWS